MLGALDALDGACTRLEVVGWVKHMNLREEPSDVPSDRWWKSFSMWQSGIPAAGPAGRLVETWLRPGIIHVFCLSETPWSLNQIPSSRLKCRD